MTAGASPRWESEMDNCGLDNGVMFGPKVGYTGIRNQKGFQWGRSGSAVPHHYRRSTAFRPKIFPGGQNKEQAKWTFRALHAPFSFLRIASSWVLGN